MQNNPTYMIPARLLLDNAIVIMFHRWENLSISQLVNEEVGVQTSKPGCFISHSSLGFVTVQAFHQEDFPERARYREQTGPGLIFRKVKMLVTQSFPTLYDPMDCCPPGSSVHGILQASPLERAAIPFSRGSSWPRDWTQVSYITGRFFTIWATMESQLEYLSHSILIHLISKYRKIETEREICWSTWVTCSSL